MKDSLTLIMLLGLGNCLRADIVLDFSPDAATDNFFARNADAKAAVEKAATDLNAVLDTPLVALDSRDVIEGKYNQTSAVLAWQLSYDNPSTGRSIDFDPAILAENEVRIFVGMSELMGDVAGTGGPGAIGLSAGAGGSPDEFAQAIEDLQANVDALLDRNGGPVIASLSFPDFLGTGESLDVQVGSTIGALTLDIDRNNNGQPDSDAELAADWHYDAYAPVAAGKTDLYSVALHEIVHAIGFGASHAWQTMAAGDTWLGAAAIEANGGSGAGLISGGHVDSAIMSQRISDGTAQSPIMNASVLAGTRQELTEMDLAILQDLGWTLKANDSVTGDFDQDGGLDIDDVNLLIQAFGPGENEFDLVQNNVVDIDDLNSWIKDLKNTWVGDANLDGEFNSSDLVEVFLPGKFETDQSAGWHEGDWNGDQRFTTTDFVVAFGDGGFEQGARAAHVVPEPTGLLIPLLFVAGLLRKLYA